MNPGTKDDSNWVVLKNCLLYSKMTFFVCICSDYKIDFIYLISTVPPFPNLYSPMQGSLQHITTIRKIKNKENILFNVTVLKEFFQQ